MKTQVVVPAQNEAQRLPRLLRRLGRDDFDVFVGVNASDDCTADVARQYGVHVFESDTPGKLPAIQHVLKRLGSSALEPLLLLDADTRPIIPERWSARMMTALRQNGSVPAVVSAPIVFDVDRHALADPVIRSFYRYAETARTRRRALRSALDGSQYGPNMGIHIASSVLLEEIVELPPIWPKEDVAIVKSVLDSHPQAQFQQLLHPATAALTDRAPAMQPLLSWVLHPEETAEAESRAYRSARPSDNHVSFEDWLESHG